MTGSASDNQGELCGGGHTCLQPFIVTMSLPGGERSEGGGGRRKSSVWATALVEYGDGRRYGIWVPLRISLQQGEHRE